MNLSIAPEFGGNMGKNLEIKHLTPADENYPVLLRQIADAPGLLYYRGRLPVSDELCIAVVGTRKATAYGQRITPELVQPLSRSGITIVSGLAYGIDAFAHRAALEAGGCTIAVLPGGIDDASIYPYNHLRLAREILRQGGALISEYPTGTPALKHHFLARNRIIAGLAVGTLVVECDLKSGALITTGHALEQNRTVYAVPGPIFSPQSRGPHKLIKEGAVPITCAEDLFDDLRMPLEKRGGKSAQTGRDAVGSLLSTASPAEKLIFNQLVEYPLHRDEIIAAAKLPSAQVIAGLTFLEMKGIIRQLETGEYIVNK